MVKWRWRSGSVAPCHMTEGCGWKGGEVVQSSSEMEFLIVDKCI